MLRTADIVIFETRSSAPEPASKYKNLMPKYWAANAYMAARLGLLGGIPLERPINPAAPPSPMIRYAMGMASSLYFLIAKAAKACASVMKYGLSEFMRQLKNIASALGETPVTLPGNNITGDVTVDFIFVTIDSSSIWSIAVEPPTRMAFTPQFSRTLDSFAASNGLMFSESSNPTQMVPCLLIS